MPIQSVESVSDTTDESVPRIDSTGKWGEKRRASGDHQLTVAASDLPDQNDHGKVK